MKLRQLGMTSAEETKLVAMREHILKLAEARARYVCDGLIPGPSSTDQFPSYASRQRLELETDKNIKVVVGDVELQKLGVVPRTVFLKSRNAFDHTPRSSRLTTYSSRRSSGTDYLRPPMSAPIRIPRASSVDQASISTPFEDLRRRLATINGSGSSLGAQHIPKNPASPTSGIPSPSPPATASNNKPASPPAASAPERPSSPTESIVSTTNSASLKPLSRMPIGSSFEGQKAAPAVGSSKMNVAGVLEAHSKLRLEGVGSADISGRSSPLSVQGTVRGSRVPLSINPISTYGSSCHILLPYLLLKQIYRRSRTCD